MNIDWLAISPQSGKAGTNPISFQLVSENDSFEDKTIRIRAICGNARSEKTIILKGKTYPVGTVFDFAYTGSVQEITLPKGRYKLQCWGAQGGNVTGSYTATGSKGGYSEGVLTLTEPTTIYVFVGGQGTSSSTSSTSGTANGGWNGGGASVRFSDYNTSELEGCSYPRPGGGSTDMCLVTSTINYSSGRTNRSSASLLSRFIVAGGGSGASARYTRKIETTVTTEDVLINQYKVSDLVTSLNFSSSGSYYVHLLGNLNSIIKYGKKYKLSGSASSLSGTNIVTYKNSVSAGNVLYITKTAMMEIGSSDSIVRSEIRTTIELSDSSHFDNLYVDEYEEQTKEETQITPSSSQSNESQQGGGTSGRGQYPGTQNSAGSGGAFGLGANQTTTNYRYDAGAGGGGWYGGGTNKSDSSTSYVNYSGGGSGFVNTSANANYRPSGYTGLQLDSGTTTAGNSSHPSTSGGTETGHSGNGYARITVLDN